MANLAGLALSKLLCCIVSWCSEVDLDSFKDYCKRFAHVSQHVRTMYTDLRDIYMFIGGLQPAYYQCRLHACDEQIDVMQVCRHGPYVVRASS